MIAEMPQVLKKIRPTMAWNSFWIATAYILVFEVARLISQAWGTHIDGANPAIAGVLYGPCGAWVAMRTFDGFSNKGKSD